ncbi:MAG: hypothetical protein ACKOWF_13460, partial [Chloroflexota bacterium]
MAFGAALGLFAVHGGALAQATPVSAPEAPKPDLCTVEPRKFQSAGPAATPIAAPSGVLPAAASVPGGPPASGDQASALREVVVQSLACRNAGDLRRAYALMSDRMIEGILGGATGPAPELLYLLQNRSDRVARTERLELVSIDDVQALDDGRLRATVVTRNARTEFSDILLFTGSGG